MTCIHWALLIVATLGASVGATYAVHAILRDITKDKK